MAKINLEELQENLVNLRKLKEIELAFVGVEYQLNKHELREKIITKVLAGDFDQFVETEIYNNTGLGPPDIQYKITCKLKWTKKSTTMLAECEHD